jgi:hypothetical protein
MRNLFQDKNMRLIYERKLKKDGLGYYEAEVKNWLEGEVFQAALGRIN